MKLLQAEPLTSAAFAPFGDVIEFRAGDQDHAINAGTTRRFHDQATAVALGEGSRVAMSLARAEPFSTPITISMVERHPLGSQAFIPLEPARFLVVVAPDADGRPGELRAFLTSPGQGINYHVGTWHGVLTTLEKPTDFLIVDRIGSGANLEESKVDPPYQIQL